MRDGQPHAWSRVLNAQTSASLIDGFVARGTFHIIPVHFTFITARRRLRVRSTAAKHRAHVGQRKAAERKAAVARRALQAQLNSCGKNQDTFEAHSAGLAAVSLPSAPARPQWMVRAGSEGIGSQYKIMIYFNKDKNIYIIMLNVKFSMQNWYDFSPIIDSCAISI